MNYLISVLPVLLFLCFLFLLDSFKLVVKRTLFSAILWGILSAGFAFFLNNFLLHIKVLSFEQYALYIAPATEEWIKSLFVFFLVSRKKAGFLIDAAIYGFAIGAGFALVENGVYVHVASDVGFMVWILRGFGTALMHGGCTALFSLIVVGAKSRNASQRIAIGIAYVSVYLIHAAFNHFYIHPLLQTVGILIVLPLIFVLIFRRNEKQLHRWLEIEFSSEIELLQMIHKGRFPIHVPVRTWLR